MEFQELLSEKIDHLLHELSVLPFDNMDFYGYVTGLGVLTNYTSWLIIALVVVSTLFIVGANTSKRRMALAAQSGRATDLAPAGRLVGALEAGVQFIRDMATDVIGEKEGPKYVGLLATFFFLFIIIGTTSKGAASGFAGIPIGFALVLIHLISIPVTNTSVNPARSTGPALFAGAEYLDQLWLFWLAPILGAVVAGALAKWLYEPAGIVETIVVEDRAV